MKKKMYFADLTYDSGLIACDFFPLGCGYVAAYAAQSFGGEYDIEIFKFGGELLKAAENNPPDVFGGSCYAWNRNLLLSATQALRKNNPRCLIVLGGPAFPADGRRRKEFLSRNKQVDFYVPYDGEVPFVRIIEKYILSGRDKDKIKEGPIEGAVYLDKGGEFVCAEIPERPREMDILPSPYLTGLLDRFFLKGKFTPLIQTTRGCPHRCAYCWASNEQNRKIGFFSLERVNAELEYIMGMAKENGVYDLLGCDSNFGLYEKDFKILDMIGEYQRKYNYPRIFSVPYGKNIDIEYVKKISKIKGSTYCLSIQSSDEKILENVKRSKLDLVAIKRYTETVHNMGRCIDTEIIMGLPYETKKTHMQTIRDLLDCGFDRIDSFTFMLLDGIELDSEEAHKKFEYDIRYRLIPRDFGKINGHYSFELERVVVGTNTYAYDDYLYLRGFHILLKILLNDGVYQELLNYMKQQPGHVLDWIVFVFEHLKGGTSEASRCFLKYLIEIRSELWDTPEELVVFYSEEENFNKLLNRERGDNLLQKCAVMAASVNFDAYLVYFTEMAKRYLEERFERKDNFKEEIDDIAGFIRLKLDKVLTRQIEPVKSLPVRYDILSWVRDGCRSPLFNYKLEEPKELKGELSEDQMKLIGNIFSRYGVDDSNPYGLFRTLAIIGVDNYFRKIGWKKEVAAGI